MWRGVTEGNGSKEKQSTELIKGGEGRELEGRRESRSVGKSICKEGELSGRRRRKTK